MRRKRSWVLLLALVLVGGCTGTVEDPLETLLIAGYNAGGQGRLALIENNVLQGAAPPLRWLEGSERALPGLPLAADVIDRARERTALVVLSRYGARSYLSVFNLRNLAPDRLEEGFVETRIALNDLPLPPGQALCPTRLQVSSTGSHAAILNQPDVCDPASASPISISVLTLNNPPRLVGHYAGRVFPLVANALVLDQADDTLYFLEESAGGVRLERVALAELGRVRADEVGEAAIRAGEVQDMGIVSNSMVVLGGSSFAAFENYRARGHAAPPVPTSSHSRRLIGSDFADSPEVMILGRDHFTIHPGVGEPANRAPLPDHRSGTVEALNGLVFLVGDGEARVFDLHTYPGGPPDLRLFPLPGLTAPAFISWVAALAPPP